MGEPKFSRKKYDTPLHPWKEERIKQERELIKKYGLKNHKEVWRAKTYLGRYRQQARELLALADTRNPQIKKESDQLLLHLTKMGILPVGSSLDDILGIDTENVLSRRLQTLVYLKGFASTASQSRQLINHGHIKIEQRKITIPGYLVTKNEEEFIGYTEVSPLNEFSHPARPKTDMLQTISSGAPKPTTEKPQPSKPESAQKPPQDTSKPKEDKPAEPAPRQEKPTESSQPKEEKKPETSKEPEQKIPESKPIEDTPPTPAEPKKETPKPEKKSPPSVPEPKQNIESIRVNQVDDSIPDFETGDIKDKLDDYIRRKTDPLIKKVEKGIQGVDLKRPPLAPNDNMRL